MRKALNAKGVQIARNDEIAMFVDIKFGNLGNPFAYGICVMQHGFVLATKGMKDASFYAAQAEREDRTDDHHDAVLRGIKDMTSAKDKRSLINRLRADLKEVAEQVDNAPMLFGNRMSLIFLQEMLRMEQRFAVQFASINAMFSEVSAQKYASMLKTTAREAGLTGIPHDPLNSAHAMALLTLLILQD